MGTLSDYASTRCPLFGKGKESAQSDVERFDIHTPIYVGEDATGYDVKFFGDTTGKYWLWDQSADKMIVYGGVEVGVDDTGHDVKFFGATTLAYWLWDESANCTLQTTYHTQTTSAFSAGRINHYPTCASGGKSRGMMVLSEALSGTGAAWLIGITAIAEQDSTKRVDGYLAAGTFSLINAAANASAMGCLELTWKNTSSTPGAPGGSTQAYILLREYSTGTACSQLFNFVDVTVGSADATSLICEMGNATTASHVIRFCVGDTPYWILCDSTPPA